MNFAYTALNAQGVQVQESVQADNDDQALRRLQSQGYVVLSLKPAPERGGRAAAGGSAGVSLRGRAKLEQVVILSRELAIMIETGVPFAEALAALEEYAENTTLKAALRQAYADLSSGKTIAQALGNQPHVFPSLYVSMVRTAEAGGSLDQTLNQAADYLEASLEMRRKVVGALTYPALLLAVAIGVIIFMMVYLVPRFAPLFTKMGADIPTSTQFLMAASAFMRSQWWTIPATLGGGAWGLYALLRIPAGRDTLTRLLHRMPIVGDVVKKVALARSLRALGTLSGAGVSLLLALEMAGQTAQDTVFERALDAMRRDVAEGISISEAAMSARSFPPMVCQMIAVGEKSGRLSDVLVRVAHFYERDVDARLKTLASIIEPVMIVVLGLIVGFVAISVITPIYSLVGSVK